MAMTVELDADAAGLAEAYAGATGISLSAALSELVRRAERTHEPAVVAGRLQRNEHGYLEIATTGHVLTAAMVKEAAEDDLI